MSAGTPARRRWAFVDWSGDGKRERVQVVMHLGIPGCVVQWTDACSGCTEYGDYGGHLSGPCGCEECGYTGKRRRREWVPLPGYWDAFFRASNRRWKRRDRSRSGTPAHTGEVTDGKA